MLFIIEGNLPNFSLSGSFDESIDLTNNKTSSQDEINRDFDLRLQDIQVYIEQNTASLQGMMQLMKKMGEATYELDKRLTELENHLKLNEPTS